ncbi:hypothetical protein Dimus_036732, partial [Dionaea muscipula]
MAAERGWKMAAEPLIGRDSGDGHRACSRACCGGGGDARWTSCHAGSRAWAIKMRWQGRLTWPVNRARNRAW